MYSSNGANIVPLDKSMIYLFYPLYAGTSVIKQRGRMKHGLQCRTQTTADLQAHKLVVGRDALCYVTFYFYFFEMDIKKTLDEPDTLLKVCMC